MTHELTAEQIKENYDKFYKLCMSVKDRDKQITNFLDHFEERIALCPASSRMQYHNAFPGGLVEHSLRVLKNAYSISKIYDEKISKESLIVSALFHDIGKIGDFEHEYYLPQDSSWHIERGMMYKYNDKIQYMTSADRGLYLLQAFDVKLCADEWLAIKLNDGHEAEENRPYRMKEPTLAVIIHQADRAACQQEKIL
jgi:hypothetical protein